MIQVVNEEGERLNRKYATDAGIDVPMPTACVLRPREVRQFRLGVFVKWSPGWHALIQERSSTALLGVSSIGNVIDNGYEGELTAILVNHTNQYKMWSVGDRVVQILPILGLPEAQNLPKRGYKGFGSTGSA